MKLAFNIFIGFVTATVGYTIHSSAFWSVIDFFFWPVAIIKWCITHELTMNVIKQTFAWFF